MEPVTNFNQGMIKHLNENKENMLSDEDLSTCMYNIEPMSAGINKDFLLKFSVEFGKLTNKERFLFAKTCLTTLIVSPNTKKNILFLAFQIPSFRLLNGKLKFKGCSFTMLPVLGLFYRDFLMNQVGKEDTIYAIAKESYRLSTIPNSIWNKLERSIVKAISQKDTEARKYMWFLTTATPVEDEVFSGKETLLNLSLNTELNKILTTQYKEAEIKYQKEVLVEDVYSSDSSTEAKTVKLLNDLYISNEQDENFMVSQQANSSSDEDNKALITQDEEDKTAPDQIMSTICKFGGVVSKIAILKKLNRTREQAGLNKINEEVFEASLRELVAEGKLIETKKMISNEYQISEDCDYNPIGANFFPLRHKMIDEIMAKLGNSATLAELTLEINDHFNQNYSRETIKKEINKGRKFFVGNLGPDNTWVSLSLLPTSSNGFDEMTRFEEVKYILISPAQSVACRLILAMSSSALIQFEHLAAEKHLFFKEEREEFKQQQDGLVTKEFMSPNQVQRSMKVALMKRALTEMHEALHTISKFTLFDICNYPPHGFFLFVLLMYTRVPKYFEEVLALFKTILPFLTLPLTFKLAKIYLSILFEADFLTTTSDTIGMVFQANRIPIDPEQDYSHRITYEEYFNNRLAKGAWPTSSISKALSKYAQMKKGNNLSFSLNGSTEFIIAHDLLTTPSVVEEEKIKGLGGAWVALVHKDYWVRTDERKTFTGVSRELDLENKISDEGFAELVNLAMPTPQEVEDNGIDVVPEDYESDHSRGSVDYDSDGADL